MAADWCAICGEWYVTMLEPNGMCRLCELREDAWRTQIANEILDLLYSADHRRLNSEQLIRECSEKARHGM